MRDEPTRQVAWRFAAATPCRHTTKQQLVEPTSAREYEEDAQALKAEEGRGDRRNVQGELHTSEEPCESEWGNPPGVMPRHRVLNI